MLNLAVYFVWGEIPVQLALLWECTGCSYEGGALVELDEYPGYLLSIAGFLILPVLLFAYIVCNHESTCTFMKFVCLHDGFLT